MEKALWGRAQIQEEAEETAVKTIMARLIIQTIAKIRTVPFTEQAREENLSVVVKVTVELMERVAGEEDLTPVPGNNNQGYNLIL